MVGDASAQTLEQNRQPIQRRATQADVAAAAGVSVSSVSRSLRNDPRIGNDTRVRIAELADRLGYVPNVAARNLVTQRSLTLGLLIPDVIDPIHGQIVTGFQNRARQLGYSVILANGFQDASLERGVLAEFASHRVEGAVLMGTVLRHDDAVRALRPAQVVFLDAEHLGESGAHVDPLTGCIRTDDGDGMMQVARYIVDTGYRSVAFVGGTPLASEVVRRNALAAALAELDGPAALNYSIAAGGDTLYGSMVDRLRHDAPEVIVCYDDKLALTLLDALRRAGIRVPDDVSVIGFDDIPFGRISNPRLTTVTQRAESLGTLGVEMLAEALMHGELPPSRLLPATLIIRESTGVPRHRSNPQQPNP